MAIAYVVLSHRDDGQVARLIGRLLTDDPQCRVLWHHDAAAPLPKVNSHPRLERLPRLHTGWGGWQMVQAILFALGTALRWGECTYISILSGQDYPLRHLRGREQLLQTRPAWVFARPMNDVQNTGKLNRYLYFWHRLPSQPRTPAVAALRRALRPVRAFVLLADVGQVSYWGWRRPLPAGQRAVDLRAGEVWMDLSREVAESCQQHLRANPALLERARHSLHSDEFLLPTTIVKLLGDAPVDALDRFLRWAHGSSHPEVLTLDHWPLLSASPASFARKFDVSVCGDVLDRLDAQAAAAGDAAWVPR